MSDYTPSAERTPKTNTVRTGWMRGHPFPNITDIDERGAEFDRWLNAERARIWDEVISAMKYQDGTPVEIVANINPYRSARTGE